MSRVKADPWRGKHEVHMALVFVAPVLKHLLEIELADNIMRSEHGVHVCFESELCVDTPLVKLYLYKAIWVGPDDEVDFGPINHNNLLYIVNDVWQLLFRYSLHSSVHLSWLELSMKDLVLFDPL